MTRVLIAEDEAAIREFIVINLRRGGYEVIEACDGAQAIELYDACGGDIDVALLDVMMPNVDGLEVCKQLRSRSNNLGIIMLTAKTQEMDKITGLMMGADDYVTKPFSPSELIARIDALCRRIVAAQGSLAHKDTEEMLKSGPFEIDLKSRVLYKNGREIELTGVEFQIMELFIKNADTAMKRSAILKAVWDDRFKGQEKIVDVNIRRIRMKIEDEPSEPQFIQTVWGFGYKWPKM
jgi:DNA-binding response OmpR family regulator